MAWSERGKKWYKLHWKEYYAKNRKKITSNNTKFRKRNREKILAQARERYRKNRTPEKRAKARQYSLAYYYKNKGNLSREKRAKIHQNYRKWKESHPGHVRAHHIVQNEIRTGRLVRPKACSQCGKPCKPEAHHPDYAIPLSVVWLCKTCHNKITWL